MKAVVIREHGGLDRLQVDEVEAPQPGVGEALLQVAFAGLNHMDLFLRQGLTGPGVRQVHLPHIPGVEGTGHVVTLGPGTTTPFTPGDRVVAYSGLSCGHCRHCRTGRDGRCTRYRIIGEDVWGMQAEYVVVPARNLLPVPSEIPLHVAAAAPVAFATSWTMLVSAARLRVGERVAVVGASGGVATAAMAIAKRAGALVLAGTRDTRKQEQLRELPFVDHTFDTSQKGWHQQVLAYTDGCGADIVVDAVGAPTWREGIQSLAPDGRMVICGATGGDRPDISIRELYQSHRSILGAPLGGWSDFHDAMSVVLRGELAPTIHATLPLGEVAEAHRQMEAGEHLGKIVLAVT